MPTAMHETNKCWDPGTIAPYRLKESTPREGRQQEINQRAYANKRDGITIEALYNATVDTEEAPEYTATLAPDKCARVEEPGVMDSGANISITNPRIVDKLNLTPQRWERPFHIIFGNGGRFVCSHYADFGPILGRIAIVDEAPDTLLSVAVLTGRGFEV